MRYQHSYLPFNRSIFQDMVSMDALVIKVMNFAQRLVDADRASLFLVDNRSKELYARIFDVGGGSLNGGDSGSEDSTTKNSSAKEIRLSERTCCACFNCRCLQLWLEPPDAGSLLIQNCRFLSCSLRPIPKSPQNIKI